MFGVFKKMARNVERMDRNIMLEEIFSNPQLQSQMIDLNQSQMMDQGVDSYGVTLGDYSPVSVSHYGKDPGHITLRDTGAFYDSMKVLVGSEAVVISGDTEKPDRDLSVAWPHALGLTNDSLQEILPEVKQRFIESVKMKLTA